MGDEDAAGVVVFSGAALKDKLLGVFNLGAGSDSDSDDSGDSERVDVRRQRSLAAESAAGLAEAVNDRVGIGAHAAAAAERAAQQETQLAPKGMGRLVQRAKDRAKRKRPRSALEGVESELRAWDRDGSDGEEDDLGTKASAVSAPSAPKRPVATSASVAVEIAAQGEESDKASKKAKKRKAKKSKKAKTASEHVDEEQHDSKQDDQEAKAVSAPPSSGPGGAEREGTNKASQVRVADSHGAASRSLAGEGGDQGPDGPPFKKEKRPKKRSKQKNLRKDNRPPGTWKKNRDARRAAEAAAAAASGLAPAGGSGREAR